MILSILAQKVGQRPPFSFICSLVDFLSEMDVIERITRIVEPSLEAQGYSLVQLKMTEGGRGKTLSVMAERADDKAMSFDDCAEISRLIWTLLEVDDPIDGAYDLEVSSPGIDRPLTKLADFVRFEGFEAKLETQLPIDGRRRFRGVIRKNEGEMIRIKLPEGDVDVEIPFHNVKSAKLVMTEKLLNK